MIATKILVRCVIVCNKKSPAVARAREGAAAVPLAAWTGVRHARKRYNDLVAVVLASNFQID
jgi:hypothetical protein